MLMNNLKCELKDLSKEAKKTIVNYVTGDIDFITAHNELIEQGIRLTENNELFEY